MLQNSEPETFAAECVCKREASDDTDVAESFAFTQAEKI